MGKSVSAREGAGAPREPFEGEVLVGGHSEEQTGGEELWIVDQRGKEKIVFALESRGTR